MMSLIDIARKLFNKVNGCPIVFVLFCSFIIHTLCSSYPGLTLYWIYVYTFSSIKKSYRISKEKLKECQAEYEDIELQAEILKTKLCVVEAELQERSEPLHDATLKLQRVRTRVFDLIAADDGLRHLLLTAAAINEDPMQLRSTVDQQTLDMIHKEFSSDLLNGLKSDRSCEKINEPMDCGEHLENDSSARQNEFSVLNDIDGLHDCRVKIVKVTNVYKVAYLKHFIKQKRQRRSNKRALLKKKMENLMLLLENWQKMLNMVTNTKYSILNFDTRSLDVSSQETIIDDYPKTCESSDSDTDMRNDKYYDEYCRGKYEDAVSRGYNDCLDMMYSYNQFDLCRPIKMFSILEETGSQLAIEDVSDGEDGQCRDNVAI